MNTSNFNETYLYHFSSYEQLKMNHKNQYIENYKTNIRPKLNIMRYDTGVIGCDISARKTP